MFVWVYNLSTGEWLCGGPCEQPYDPATQGVVRLSRNPNPRQERYDGAGGIRQATGPELIAYDTARSVSQALIQFDDQKLIKAAVLWIAAKLSIAPATAKAEILTIYRGL